MMKIKVRAIAMDDAGREQPIELHLILGGMGQTGEGGAVNGDVVTEHGDSFGSFEFVPTPGAFNPWGGA